MRRAILLAAALLLLHGAPRSAVAEARRETPIRVATLCPFVTDALASEPDRIRVVASVRRDPATPVPAGVQDLGTPHMPNTEILAASGAELLVADRTMHAALAPKLEAKGLEVVLVDTSSIDGAFAGIVALGRRSGAAERMVAEVERARSALASHEAAREENVLALMGTASAFFVMTRRSWQGDLLERLGYRNVAAVAAGDGRMPGFAPLSDEILAGLAPDRVLLVAHGDAEAVRQAFERRVRERGLWRDAATGDLPRIQVLPAQRFLANPGLAIPDLARELVAGAAPTGVATPPAGGGR